MKLLSTPQGASKQSLDVAAQQRHLIELDDLIKAKRKELEEIDRQQLKHLSEKGRENYEEEERWKHRLAAFTVETEALESRRRSALVPLQEREKEVETKMSVLLQREEQVQIRESEIERTSEALIERLDEVGEREASAEDYAKTLNNREFALSLQENDLKGRMSALTKILMESFAEITEAKADAERRKAVLKGRDISISERERLVEEQQASFENREKKIIDQYRSLQRAITETNLTNATHKQTHRL